MSFVSTSRTVGSESRRAGKCLPLATLVTLAAAGAARAATSTTPVEFDNDQHASIVINAAGTQLTSNGSLTTNDISTYDIGFNNGTAAFLLNGYNSLQVGPGGTIEQTLTSTQYTNAVVELGSAGTTTIDGGTLELDGASGAQGTVIANGDGSTINLQSGAIDIDAANNQGPNLGVQIAGPGTSFVMTGGSINDPSGANYMVDLSAGATFTYAGGTLNSPNVSEGNVNVEDTGTINVFGTGIRIDNSPVANGTYIISPSDPSTEFQETDAYITGTLLDGTPTAFNADLDEDGGQITLNVNVGAPPAPPTVPEPASLASGSAVAGLLLSRRRRPR